MHDTRPLTVGLLPLYTELYDAALPELRRDVEAFRDDVATAIGDLGVLVHTAPVCRQESEFESAVAEIERLGADAIVTLHLAYSPSLECEGPLSRTQLPLIILDTTPSERFDETTHPHQMMLNHGIHGVQDMCNRLLRAGKRFEIHAGHPGLSDVLDRLHRSIRAAAVVSHMRGARVGLVGKPFAGMGDFRVDFAELERELGPVVVPDAHGLPAVTDLDAADVRAEIEIDHERFDGADTIDSGLHDTASRAGLALRRWVESERLDAVAVSFLMASAGNPAMPVMPFVECCKMMERGLGYAGEGDVLTAAWVGALLRAFPETTFTEMFCPDWSGEAVFLSHMGELNYRIADGRPRLERLAFPYTDSGEALVGYASYRPGEAVLANLAPFGNGRYRLTIAPGRVRQTAADNALSSLVNGWFLPQTGLSGFLEEFSRGGGTHHSALVYGAGADVVPALQTAGRFLGCEVTTIGSAP